MIGREDTSESTDREKSEMSVEYYPAGKVRVTNADSSKVQVAEEGKMH